MMEEGKFSIFDPVITHKHREFYEQIVNELNVILPVCNHGKSLAVDIGRNAKEQDTIKDLMNRVETFRGELLAGTKNLFGQFYLAKEEFYRMILATVAYGKINTLDRNLLERTCDVRWWALETAFSDCLVSFNHASEFVAIMAQEMAKELVALKADERLRKLNRGLPCKELEALSHFASLFEGRNSALLSSSSLKEALELVRPLTEFLVKSASANNLADIIERCVRECKEAQAKINFACDRLEVIRSSYTLYRDLTLCDAKGIVIANSNRNTREQVVGLDVSDEKWFSKAVGLSNGSEYYAQNIAFSKVEGQDSLVYSTAIRQGEGLNGAAIGALGVFFDFQGEAQIILNDHMPKDASGKISDGWYAFFSNKEGRVLASSDEFIFETGSRAALPAGHRALKPGKTYDSYLVAGGRESGVFTARTDGYLDYKGQDWNSHVVVLKSIIFNDQADAIDIKVDLGELMDSQITPEINKRTYKNIERDKRTLQLISTNGILFATELGSRGQTLGPVFEQITKTGDFATRCMEELLHEMALEELALNFRTLKMFSHQAIELMDRNLFERAADIRWWATDKFLWEALSKPSPESFRKACDRLKVVNSNYTMYRNIVLSSSKGEIVACSSSAQLQRLQGLNVADNEWFVQGMQTQKATEFAVQDVQRSELEKGKETSLIYAGGVRSGGSREGESIGVIGVLFDWDTEAEKMLKCCLPKDRDGKFIEGSASFYTNRNGVVIESTSPEVFPVGKAVKLPASCEDLATGASAAGILEHGGRKYLIGSSRTRGYREYKGLAWSAHVVRPY